MVGFFAVVASWLFVRNLQEPSRTHWGLYAVACALGTYSHFFAVMLVLAHALSLLLLRRDEIPWRNLVCSLLVFGVLISPVALVVLRGDPTELSWVPPMQFNSLLLLGVAFSGNYGQLLLALDILAIGIAALLASGARRDGEPANGTWRYGLAFFWLVAPLVIVAAVSLVRPAFVQRYFTFCPPALLLLVAAGISRLRPVILSWACWQQSVCARY